MFIPRRLYLAHIEDCSALWIGNLTLIDVDVHLQPLCNTFCLQECIYSYFSGHLLWFLFTTFLISKKYRLFHPPEDCIGTFKSSWTNRQLRRAHRRDKLSLWSLSSIPQHL
jgi:hypothetical protein